MKMYISMMVAVMCAETAFCDKATFSAVVIDAKTGDKYVCRRYVTFTVTCTYVPQEQVVVESNVNVPEEAAQ